MDVIGILLIIVVMLVLFASPIVALFSSRAWATRLLAFWWIAMGPAMGLGIMGLGLYVGDLLMIVLACAWIVFGSALVTRLWGGHPGALSAHITVCWVALGLGTLVMLLGTPERRSSAVGGFVLSMMALAAGIRHRRSEVPHPRPAS
jgi:hypothetical protein